MNRKQLITLLVVAAWISAVALYQDNEWSNFGPDVAVVWKELASIFVYSLPAMLFGGVLWFWFRRSGNG